MNLKIGVIKGDGIGPEIVTEAMKVLDKVGEVVIEYLKNNGGYDYKLYNQICPDMGEPDSNIVEYAEDVLYMINLLIDNK